MPGRQAPSHPSRAAGDDGGEDGKGRMAAEGMTAGSDMTARTATPSWPSLTRPPTPYFPRPPLYFGRCPASPCVLRGLRAFPEVQRHLAVRARAHLVEARLADAGALVGAALCGGTPGSGSSSPALAPSGEAGRPRGRQVGVAAVFARRRRSGRPRARPRPGAPAGRRRSRARSPAGA